MTAHRIEFDLGKRESLADPGNGGSFFLGGRSYAYSVVTTTGASETRTLPSPDGEGLQFTVIHGVDGGDFDLTVTNGFNEDDNTDIAIATAGDYVTFISTQTAADTYRWRVLGSHGLAEASEADVLLVNTINEATSGSGVTFTDEIILSGGDHTRQVNLTDANASISTGNSGKIHYIDNVSADRTFTLPTAAAGLRYEFWSTVAAADGHDWIIVAASAADFLIGGILFVDSDIAGSSSEVILSAPNNTDDHTIQVNLPSVGTWLKFYCDGTNWFISGMVFSTTAPTYT